MKKIILSFLLGIFICGCSENTPRKPLQKKSGTFLTESVERNKELIKKEEAIIDSIIKLDNNVNYSATTKGFWIGTDSTRIETNLQPKKGDIVYYDYEVTHLDGKPIYTKGDFTTQKYRVDEEEIIPGLRYGLKLMHENETAIFYFPSHMAYGYIGDKNKIGPYTPLKYRVTISKITKKSFESIINENNN